MQQALKIYRFSITFLIIVAPLLTLMEVVYVTPSWLDLEAYSVTLLDFDLNIVGHTVDSHDILLVELHAIM